jgi:hypothetical protein
MEGGVNRSSKQPPKAIKGGEPKAWEEVRKEAKKCFADRKEGGC